MNISRQEVIEPTDTPYLQLSDIAAAIRDLDVSSRMAESVPNALLRNAHPTSPRRNPQVAAREQAEGVTYVLKQEEAWLIHPNYLRLAAEKPNLISGFGEMSAFCIQRCLETFETEPDHT